MIASLRRRFRRVLALAWVELLQVRRDRTSLVLIFSVPAMQLLLFGYAVNLDPRNIPIAVSGDGRSSERLHQAIRATGYFTVVGEHLPPGDAERLLTKGRVLIAIELPAEDSGGEPRVIVDATDPAAVRPALAALEATYWREEARAASFGFLPAVDVEWRYNPKGLTTWTIVPALVGVIVMISMLMLGALAQVRERERGTWEALLATPVDGLDAFVGKLAPYMVIGSIQAVIVLVLARLLFALPVTAGVAALLVAIPLYAAGNLAFGFAISTLARNQAQAIQGAVVFYLPSMLLSGFMFPFEGMPPWARFLGNLLPLTHFIRATRGVLLRGEGIALVVREMSPIALFTLVALAAALACFRIRID